MIINNAKNERIVEINYFQNGRRPSYYLRNPEQIDFKAADMKREIILEEAIDLLYFLKFS